MPSTALLITKLKSDFPQFKFEAGGDFMWSPMDKTIHFKPDVPENALILHELSHGILGHNTYQHDIELIGMERAAWDNALRIADKYSVKIDDNIVESNLDSYREWLHDRSTCPKCQATGTQIKPKLYKCLACGNSWRVNEARICALRRYSLDK
jgi:hypothetical protein